MTLLRRAGPVVVLSSLACAGVELPVELPVDRPVEAPDSRLRPASALTTSCFGWPDRPWTRRNRAGKPQTRIGTGDPAIDFTLKDTDGRSHRLAELLETKPVLLVQGSYTCPRYQETESAIGGIGRDFASDLHTVLVYNVEAHPKAEPTPYHGEPREHAYSDRPQATDYGTRVDYANDLQLGPDVLVLVDALGGRGSNPVWCSYGTCPSCSWLIRRDGTVEAVHLWTDPPTLRGSIEALLARGG